MSVHVMKAVYASRLEHRLRLLAVTLASFSPNDDGGEIYPGVTRLMQMLDMEKRAVRAQLHQLIARGVLLRDGYRGHARCYRYDLDRLASYEPRQLDSGARVHGGAPLRVHDGAPIETAKGAQPCRQGCTPVPLRVHARALDPKDPKDLRKRTGADAPECSDEGQTAEKAEEPTAELSRHIPVCGKPEEEPAEEADSTPSQVPPFKVYAAIAQRALDISLRDDKSDNVGNIAEHFKILCAKQHLPYGAFITQRAVDAALASRERSKQKFLRELRQVAEHKPLKMADETVIERAAPVILAMMGER